MAFGDKIDVLQVSRVDGGLRLQLDGIPAGFVGTATKRTAAHPDAGGLAETVALVALLRDTAEGVLVAAGLGKGITVEEALRRAWVAGWTAGRSGDEGDDDSGKMAYARAHAGEVLS